jgi:hypothetical protein
MSTEKNPTTGLVVELFGPTVEFLTSPEDQRNDFCVLKGTIPPGACSKTLGSAVGWRCSMSAVALAMSACLQPSW